ncbi:MAG: metalloregulator ArsR/SmtB family transcription factor [Alicyclobacillus macrosporangiidus]|uniref:ArsR/SmtB family transcription factor n=1 Tax=Alicyclobacillus macrosporangiidus TaxID=392015 RepID=UPI0026EF7541|nr:metalloregulator ArsR/SmtB family transcription factor [Alicyclobacillus macrosporangiidus]MCL6597505.1 metalloregulator ArsR/SmtB family transcription factor [Alicyclobacillus macrosporangiidus]
MREDTLIPANASPRYRVKYSLAVNMCTAMILVDHACHGEMTPTEWPYAVARRMNEIEKTWLLDVRSILAHGWVLREFILKYVPDNHSLHETWPAFHDWLEHLDDDSVLNLVDEGIVSGLDYYEEHLAPMPEVETYLRQLETRVPDLNMLKRPGIRELGIRALLVSWGIESPDPLATVLLSPATLRQRMADVIHAIWKHGFQQIWTEHAPQVRELCDNLSNQKLPPMSVRELVTRITGLEPTQKAFQHLDGRKEIVFIPCLHLGEFLSIFAIGSNSYILFDPVQRTEVTGAMSARTSRGLQGNPDMVRKLEALGDAVRLHVLELVKENPDIHAQQISEALGVHQSTVSRHCQQLEQSGLVRVQREGNLKRYRLNYDAIRELSGWLVDFLG